MFTFMQYLKHPDTEGLYSEDKVIKALEKSIKEWAYAIHDKPTVTARVRSLLLISTA